MTEDCAYCGRKRQGMASVSSGGETRYVCHSDERCCYELVTTYHRKFPDGWSLPMSGMVELALGSLSLPPFMHENGDRNHDDQRLGGK